jgi:3D (Asp-Asp-Asp) domain-containing protein
MKKILTEILDFINHPVITFGIALLLALAIWGGDTAETKPIDGNIKNETETLGLKSLGTFKITAYCPCEKCCGKTDGITATGVTATAGRTIAVDPNVIPYGTELFIDGFTYRAEDTGGSIKGNKLDIFFENHLEALEWGVREYEVFIYE